MPHGLVVSSLNHQTFPSKTDYTQNATIKNTSCRCQPDIQSKGTSFPKKSCLNQLLGYDRVAQQLSYLQAWNRWRKKKTTIHLIFLKFPPKITTVQWKQNQQTEKHSTPSRPVLTGALNLQIQPDRLRWLHREQSHTSSSTRSPDPVDLRCLELKDWTSRKIGHVSFGFFLMDAILGLQILKRISDPLFCFFWTCLGEESILAHGRHGDPHCFTGLHSTKPT